MLQKKKAVVFDLDGTLIDSVGIWNQVDLQLIQQLGGPDLCEEEVQTQRDQALRGFREAGDPYREYCRYLGQLCRCHLPPEDIFQKRYEIAQDYLERVVDYKPDAERLLTFLQTNGFLLAIATTTKRSNLDIYRTKNQNILQKAPLDRFFSVIYTKEDVKNIKPDPEIYQRLLRELRLSPAGCLVFEDSLVGVEAARHAGIEVAAVYDRYSEKDWETIKNMADYSFEGFREVINNLEQNDKSIESGH